MKYIDGHMPYLKSVLKGSQIIERSQIEAIKGNLTCLSMFCTEH